MEEVQKEIAIMWLSHDAERKAVCGVCTSSLQEVVRRW